MNDKRTVLESKLLDGGLYCKYKIELVKVEYEFNGEPQVLYQVTKSYISEHLTDKHYYGVSTYKSKKWAQRLYWTIGYFTKMHVE